MKPIFMILMAMPLLLSWSLPARAGIIGEVVENLFDGDDDKKKEEKKTAKVDCRVVRDSSIPSNLLAGESIDSIQSESFLQNRYALFNLMCGLRADSEVNPVNLAGSWNINLPACGSSTDEKLCLLKSAFPSISLNGAMKETGAYLLLRNLSPRQSTSIDLGSLDPRIKLANEDEAIFDFKMVGTSGSFVLGGGAIQTSCQVMVSGILSGNMGEVTCSAMQSGCVPKAAALVDNGRLQFSVSLKGTTSDISFPKAVKWSGGPDAAGLWQNPPVGTEQLVSATVTTQDGHDIYCGIKFTQLGQGHSVRINKYGDCPMFRALKKYYFYGADDKSLMTRGYRPALTIPGFKVSYGASKPDVPFRGVLNVAEDKSGEIAVDNGRIISPSASFSDFTKAVIVARNFDPKTQKVGGPVYYGTMDPANYSVTKLVPVPGASQGLNDDSLITFQLFLAARQMKNGVDLRGTPNGLALWQFDETKGDRLVPVMNDSCMPVFQIRTPKRADKPLPAELEDAITCAFSRPFKAEEFRAGRSQIQALHMVPATAYATFPTDLLNSNSAASAQVLDSAIAASQAAALGPSQACWVINPGVLGSPTWTSKPPSGPSMKQAADECSTEKGGGEGSVGYRYSWNAYAWGAALGCAVTQDWSDTSVYGVVQGSAAGSGRTTRPPLSGPSFGDISCVKGSKRMSNNDIAYAYYYNYNLKMTSFAFSKSEAPAGSIRNQTIYIRPHGHQSSKLASDSTAHFTAPLCPGSQFQYDNISVSRSPLILDIKGKGIRLSRSFEESVGFDITNTRYLSYVDWPLNTNEAAFLVLPDKKGQVTSMSQLFGDDEFKNGFAKLASLDSDANRRIDKKDKKFKKLRLWFDRNRNGKVDRGELVSLASQGVEWISLDYSRPGVGPAAHQRTLTGSYFNSKLKKFMSIEDHYFNEYVDTRRRTFELGAHVVKRRVSMGR